MGSNRCPGSWPEYDDLKADDHVPARDDLVVDDYVPVLDDLADEHETNVSCNPFKLHRLAIQLTLGLF
ncbi:hypothetical protein KCU71_g1928, partial [Aureobasidium melanogenum]